MRTGVPCNENRSFPVRIDLQGVLCKPYRVWVYSALISSAIKENITQEVKIIVIRFSIKVAC
jgi:hypothetical protein